MGTMDVTEILKEALSLPPAARVASADSLLDSIEPGIDEDAEGLWREEIRRRVADLDSRSVRTIGWDEVEAALAKQIRE